MGWSDTSVKEPGENHAADIAALVRMLNWIELQACDMNANRSARLIRQSAAVLKEEMGAQGA